MSQTPPTQSIRSSKDRSPIFGDRPSFELTRKKSKLLLGLLLAFQLFVGIHGLGFGGHWDEDLWVGTTRDSIRNRLFTPKRFDWNSLAYDVHLVSAGIFGLRHAKELGSTPWGLVQDLFSPLLVKDSLYPLRTVENFDQRLFKKRMQLRETKFMELLETRQYPRQTRTIFCILSSLTLLWVFGAAATLSRSRGWGLVAATIFAGSFEFSYHSRWPSPDPIQTQFVALGFYMLCLAMREEEWRRLRHAAAAMGIAMSGKITACLGIVSVLVAYWSQAVQPTQPKRKSIPWRLIAWFIGGFLLTTPGAYIDPIGFIRDQRMQWLHYGDLGHGAYTVSGFFDHALRAFLYLTTAGLSANMGIAIALSLFCVWGIYALWTFNRSETYSILVFPVLLTLLLVRSNVMIVRNLLPLQPYLAVFAALGAQELVYRMQNRSVILSRLFYACLGLALLFNLGWNLNGALSISRQQHWDRTITAWVTNHPEEKILLGAHARAWFAPGDLKQIQPHLTESPSEATHAILSNEDIAPSNAAPCNWPGIYHQLAPGPWDVNFDYYTTYTSAFRPILVDGPTAVKIYSGLKPSALQALQTE